MRKFSLAILAISLSLLSAMAGPTVILTVIPVTSAALYDANDCVGGLLTFVAPVQADGASTVLKSIRIWDKDGQHPAIKLFIFNCNPIGAEGWTFTDAAAVAAPTTPTEIPACISITSANWLTTDSKSHVDFSGLDIPLNSASGQSRSIFAAIVTTGTPTYTSTSALIVKATFESK